jgi:hydroxymethylglutaryl-CoA lyase
MIRIIEVGPRDGLQNEATPIPTEAKLAFIKNLLAAGLNEIEATSFVSPKWVPQLGDAAELWPQLPREDGALFSALVPNQKGLERAIEVGVQRIAVFTAASDSFTQKNINMTVDQSLDVFHQVVQEFRSKVAHGWVRGYVSTAFECPYAGRIEPKQVVRVCQRLLDMGVDELSIGDTIGVAAPKEVETLTKALADIAPLSMIAYHFHDTRGTAIANVAKAFEMGIEAFDSSAAGLGGCPYAPGAGGNLATEDLVYFLERSGAPTGVDLDRLAEASIPILQVLGRSPAAKAQLAALAHAAAASTSPKG